METDELRCMLLNTTLAQPAVATNDAAAPRCESSRTMGLKQSNAMLAGRGCWASTRWIVNGMFANELKILQRMSIEEHTAKMDDDASEQLRLDTTILTRVRCTAGTGNHCLIVTSRIR